MTTVTVFEERPILFSGPMVRAILDGRKMQTRRVMKPQPPRAAAVVDPYNGNLDHFTAWSADHKMFLELGNVPGTAHWRCPYGKLGDWLWVRETWLPFIPEHVMDGKRYAYRADIKRDFEDVERCRKELHYKWKPSIFMPREACRIKLEVTGLRAQKLQEISEEDAIAEGVDAVSQDDVRRQATWSRRQDFAGLWDRLNAKRGFGWDVNAWVWVIEFKRIEKEGKAQ